jgi:hypothetical protein
LIKWLILENNRRRPINLEKEEEEEEEVEEEEAIEVAEDSVEVDEDEVEEVEEEEVAEVVLKKKVVHGSQLPSWVVLFLTN